MTGKYSFIVNRPDGILREGRPSGIGPGVPILSRPLSLKRRDIGVTTNNAKRGDGTHSLNYLGVRKTIARVITATEIAAPFGSKFPATVERDVITLPCVLIPRSGPI